MVHKWCFLGLPGVWYQLWKVSRARLTWWQPLILVLDQDLAPVAWPPVAYVWTPGHHHHWSQSHCTVHTTIATIVRTFTISSKSWMIWFLLLNIQNPELPWHQEFPNFDRSSNLILPDCLAGWSWSIFDLIDWFYSFVEMIETFKHVRTRTKVHVDNINIQKGTIASWIKLFFVFYESFVWDCKDSYNLFKQTPHSYFEVHFPFVSFAWLPMNYEQKFSQILSDFINFKIGGVWK